MSENKEEYKRFIKNRSDIPIFFRDWWLDIVSEGKTWDVILIKDKEGCIKLVLPFVIHKQYNFKISVQPPLTPYLGAIIFPPLQKLRRVKRYSYEQQLLERLADDLHARKLLYFNQLFAFDFSNWKALYWKDYQQTTYYRFVLDNIKDKETTLAGFKYSKRYELNKFEQSENTIEEGENAGLMYDLILSSYGDHQGKVPFSKRLYLKLDQAIQKHGHRKIFFAKNKEGQIIAGVLLIIDFDCAYLLNTGMDYQYKDSTVKTALIWHSIRYASKFVDRYDFCGSMIQPISDFFRGFGGYSRPYFRVYKYQNRLVKAIFALLGK